MERDLKAYLENSVFLFDVIRGMLRAHGKFFATKAALGDVTCASALLNTNIVLASIDTILGTVPELEKTEQKNEQKAAEQKEEKEVN